MSEEVIKIEGGHRLRGSVKISGSKNATVALIPAAILANGPVTTCGVPNISDVESLSVLLRDLGVDVCIKESKDHIVIDLRIWKISQCFRMRCRSLGHLIISWGALLGKYGKVVMKMPGGCYLGPRPIDLHLKGFEALGAAVKYEHGAYEITADKLIGNKIFLDISSVGATINIMMLPFMQAGPYNY